MDTRTGQLYTPEELATMNQKQLDKLERITQEEYNRLGQVKPKRRSAILKKMRGHLPSEQ